MEKVYRLTPVIKDAIWGGRRLFDYGKQSVLDRIAESWEVSFVEGDEARTDDGKILSEVLPKALWGEACRDFERFPVLTKFIDAAEKLSVQVHPSDEYALKYENSYGKTEMWYVVDAAPGAGRYIGLREATSRERFAAAVADGSVEELLSFVPCHPGDVFFIPAGTVHAICEGVLIYEIQQNSTLTYRLYDYMRRDKAGNLRPLHIDRAMNVLDTAPYASPDLSACEPGLIGKCKYFEVCERAVSGSARLTVDSDSYLAITCVKGSGAVEGISASAGDSFIAPAGVGEIAIEGDMTLILVKTPTPCE